MSTYTPETNSEIDPSLNIRSDLWLSMTIAQLSMQQELVLDKLTKMHSFIGQNTTPSMLAIYGALHVALKDLNELIDNKSTSK